MALLRESGKLGKTYSGLQPDSRQQSTVTAGQPYSMDLRERFVSAIEKGDMAVLLNMRYI
jgi:hypothetical protein